eukprot:m.198689 g.198689  ORF g.198689 m.198689 type:complete len:364 (-) comp18757_c1_seq1:469-1560(-)
MQYITSRTWTGNVAMVMTCCCGMFTANSCHSGGFLWRLSGTLFTIALIILEVLVSPGNCVIQTIEPQSESLPQQPGRFNASRGDRVLWLHVPKSGGTALARVAHDCAQLHGGKIAWCYQRGGPDVDDCSVPQGTLAKHKALQTASFGQYLPTLQMRTDDHTQKQPQPMMVYGHGVRFGCHNRWNLNGRTIYVIMVRHPLERLFSSFQQAQRDRHSVNHGKSLQDYVSQCVTTKDIPGGSLLHYLTDKNVTGGVDVNQDKTLSLDEKLKIAFAALDSGKILVLIHDRWAESMSLLESYGILPRHAKNVDSLNASPGGATIDIEYGAIPAVRQCIALEERLYLHAVDIFERNYAVSRAHPVIRGR